MRASGPEHFTAYWSGCPWKAGGDVADVRGGQVPNVACPCYYPAGPWCGPPNYRARWIPRRLCVARCWPFVAKATATTAGDVQGRLGPNQSYPCYCPTYVWCNPLRCWASTLPCCPPAACLQHSAVPRRFRTAHLSPSTTTAAATTEGTSVATAQMLE